MRSSRGKSRSPLKPQITGRYRVNVAAGFQAGGDEPGPAADQREAERGGVHLLGARLHAGAPVQHRGTGAAAVWRSLYSHTFAKQLQFLPAVVCLFWLILSFVFCIFIVCLFQKTIAVT